MNIFNLHLPKELTVPIVASIPHSGTFIPESLIPQFTEKQLQCLEETDWHVEKLYQFLPLLGVPVIQATHSRYIVDVNREVKEPFFGRFETSIVPATTVSGEPIYKQKPTREEIQERIATFYEPYHAELKALIERSLEKFGRVYLLDLHSFWGLNLPSPIEICLGNQRNQTCSEELISTVEQFFVKQGYRVGRNQLFPGGYITKHYSQIPGVEALQIEVRHRVYLDEELTSRFPEWQGAKFQEASLKFHEIFSSIVRILSQRALPNS